MLKEVYLRNSLIPKRYLKDIKLEPAKQDVQTFRDLKAIQDTIKQFVDDGSNLLIYSGNVGNGKTTWSTKLLKSYIDSVQNIQFKNNAPALFVNVTNLLNEKKLAIDNVDLQAKVRDIESKIMTARLVVFDDVAVKGLSPYDMGNLYYWIDERTSNLKSCIFTTNLTPAALKTTLDERLYSRIVNYSIIKQIKDGDSRAVEGVSK